MEDNLIGVNFFGTDGIRGKTDARQVSPLDALKIFRKSAVITPALIELAVCCFTRLVGGSSASVYVTGSDGRDSVTDNAFVNAMNRGFARGGSRVIYLGVVPTPTVPQYQLENGCLGGAMLTASHNPSNQNGIKFFYNGKKLLPEGEIGDKALSALMYETALKGLPAAENLGPVESVDAKDLVFRTLEKNIPVNCIRNARFILDTAAGAWTKYADYYFKKAGLNFTRISADEKGYNINHNCGVAEIEGHDFYGRADIPYSPMIVKTLFDNPDAYGIVTDGDGDRGMLLKYEKATDSVHVYDGDLEAFLILGLMEKTGQNVQGSTIICTLESDIMASVSFAERFGCKAVITDVGDKWICNSGNDDFSVGFESSGHVIIPLRLDSGKMLLSGNGLLTAVLSAAAIEQGCKVFERGFAKTFYTYFVDKSLFARGTALFNEDSVMLRNALADAGAGEFHERRFKDENVLAYEVVKDGLTVALIVSRNSGTEDKNAVYLKCIPSLVNTLRPVATSLASRHKEKMRNRNLPEFAMSQEILDEIGRKGEFTISEEKKSDTRLIAVLHALEREGLIKGDGSRFTSAE